jgi:hypothetical protein
MTGPNASAITDKRVKLVLELTLKEYDADGLPTSCAR